MTEDVAAKGDFVVGRRVAGAVAKEYFVVRRGVAEVVAPKGDFVVGRGVLNVALSVRVGHTNCCC